MFQSQITKKSPARYVYYMKYIFKVDYGGLLGNSKNQAPRIQYGSTIDGSKEFNKSL